MDDTNNYFLNENIDESERRNNAFQVTNAVRESLSLAQKGQQNITYETALQYIHELSPESYDGIISLLQKKNESEDVKFYKEKAKAVSKDNQEISPTTLIDQDIAEIDELLKTATETSSLRKRKGQLIAARDYFNPRTISEHKILMSDFKLAEHPDVKQVIYSNDSYKDYVLSNNQRLRLRLLHPDNAEAILGTDLIYEQFDLLTHQVRFVHLQYKAWDTKTLYTNEKRLQSQMSKMEKHLCKGGYCLSLTGTRHSNDFRYPYCSAFLRPTTNKESADSKFKSTGQHLPICEALKFGKEKITSENIKEKSVSHMIFEEQFLSNMIGSRRIHMDELDTFYKTANLNYLSDTIRVHAQEYIIPSEEQVQIKKGKSKIKK
jgi:hypothetical protein